MKLLQMKTFMFFGLLLVLLQVTAQTPSDTVKIIRKPSFPNLEEIQNKIEYLDGARIDGIQGTVHMKVRFSEQGTYMEHILIFSPHPILTDAVTKYIDQLVVIPPINKDSMPIGFWVHIPFQFTLGRNKHILKLASRKDTYKLFEAIEYRKGEALQVLMHYDKKGQYRSHEVLYKSSEHIYEAFKPLLPQVVCVPFHPEAKFLSNNSYLLDIIFRDSPPQAGLPAFTIHSR